MRSTKRLRITLTIDRPDLAGVDEVADEEKEWMRERLERYLLDLTWELRDRRKPGAEMGVKAPTTEPMTRGGERGGEG
jgi:hypothetical protein